MRNHSAFTLVELAIVLVIIGLLVGGVMAGQTLVRASELRAITAESEKFKTSINGFRNKYLNYPGDITNATAFWGALHATPATCDTMAATSPSTATCNGDGNRMVGATDGTGYEPLRFWQHMANAEMVEGFFSGTGASYVTVAKTNVPQSKLSNGVWCVRYRPRATGDTTWFDEYIDNHALVLGDDGVAGCMAKVLPPIDALQVDTKMDDGKPGIGAVQATFRTACTTSTGSGDRAATYTITNNANDCGLVIRNAF